MATYCFRRDSCKREDHLKNGAINSSTFEPVIHTIRLTDEGISFIVQEIEDEFSIEGIESLVGGKNGRNGRRSASPEAMK